MRSQLLRTVPVVVAAAVVGGLGTKPRSDWYRSLDKPRWNPPNAIFGPVWSAIYALTAAGTARAMAHSEEAERRDLERRLWLNMALNAGWCWLFFTAQKPALALLEITALEASTTDLGRRAAAADPAAGTMIAPYIAWNAFASALNAEILRRNR